MLAQMTDDSLAPSGATAAAEHVDVCRERLLAHDRVRETVASVPTGEERP
jgi:hypothetical protein